ncbi:lysM domain-containing protein ARB_03442-like isoform X2 [Salvia miltiorrhiza]|uniref:lysM domain-containing protein ARB_03442-like isoform X2 n=1 Tax=Salvia miltiorrhiza TaxID=226208 RepID=UPI0025ACB727|nr:lysM domain-containing protein ARB_03442-like isoform X2 [Salvia miltiorrhiza]
MAHQTNNAFFFKLALVLSLVLMMSIAESVNLRVGFKKQDAADAVCNSVHGTESDETCSSVAQEFNLSLDEFLAINPNINCDSVFVGQRLCVDGSA